MNNCPLGSFAREGEEPIPIRIGPRPELPKLDEVSRAAFDSLPYFFMLVDAQHTILFANRAVRDAVGARCSDPTGAYCPKAIHGLSHPFPGCPLEEAAAEHVSVERDFYDGASHTWTSSAIYPTTIRTESGIPVYAHVVRDITAERSARSAARERAAVQQLISRLATGFLTAAPLELAGELTKALRLVAEFVGSGRASLYLADDSGERLVLAREWQAPSGSHAHAPLPDGLPIEQPPIPEDWALVVPISVAGARNGFARFENSSGAPGPRFHDPDLKELLSTTLSVGIERMRAAQGMSDYAQRLRSMALELSTAEERERRRIAADLHDQIGQTLALSMLKVSSLRPLAKSAKMSAVLDEVHAHIEAALGDAKSLMFELSPPVLHQFGLGAALEWLVEQSAARTGADYRLTNDAGECRLDEDQEMFLFRATQELIANVHRHAQARHIQVRLSREAGDVEVRVIDDGVGMPARLLAKTNRPSPRGFGLFSIEQRLNHLGGTMLVETAPGEGTRVTLRLRGGSAREREP